MNSRPRSEEPFRLASSPPRSVPQNGFRWVSGQSGHTVAQKHNGLFLVPNRGGGRVVMPPSDLYLKFLEVKPDSQSTLQFANRFGALGLHSEHFHSDDSSVQFGESAGDWGNAVREFQLYFGLWQMAEERNRIPLRELLIQVGAPLQNEAFKSILTRNIVKTAKSYVVNRINRNLGAGVRFILPAYQTCFRKDCTGRTQPPKITAHVSWQLLLTDTRGRVSVQMRLMPDTLLATIWFQFADLVCGSKVIRPCEECGKWMDISENARKASKRMHENCSLKRRMQKWRKKTRNAEPSRRASLPRRLG
jgi:hypothetical protein